MSYRFLKLFTLCISLSLILNPIHTEAVGKKQVYQPQKHVSLAMVQLQSHLKKLWIDHIVWTRNYIVSSVAGSEDQQIVLARLLKNQQELGDAFKPYYGEEAGNTLASLLREHILIAGKIIDAAKQGNQDDVNKFNVEWYKNADDIARFLSNANPNWSFKQLQNLFYTHLQLVTDAVKARLTKNWEADIIAFDKGQEHIIMLADVLTAGIIKQFSKKFK